MNGKEPVKIKIVGDETISPRSLEVGLGAGAHKQQFTVSYFFSFLLICQITTLRELIL